MIIFFISLYYKVYAYNNYILFTFKYYMHTINCNYIDKIMEHITTYIINSISLYKLKYQ